MIYDRIFDRVGWAVVWLLVLSPLIGGACAAVAPIAESALSAVAPILADALTNEIKRKFGPDAEPDPTTAVCVRHDGSALEDYPEQLADRGWVICFVDRVKVD